MLGHLRKLLAECHVTGGGVVNTLAEANYDYCIARASEEMDYAKQATDPEEANRRLILAIRLLNLARYKLCTPSNLPAKATLAPKRKSKKQSSPS